MNKPSFGMGYGINRKTGGTATLGTAVPPLRSVSVHPGGTGGKYTKPSGMKHTIGAKIDSNKAPHKKR